MQVLIASGAVSAPLRSALASAVLALATSAARAAPVVEAEPSRVVLGPKARVEITVRNAGPMLRGVASAGTLAPGTEAEGVRRFIWTPAPDARAPMLVLLAFWDVEAPTLSDVTVLGLPCAGRTELAIDTEPGAKVTVEVAGTRFGPRKADPQGRLRVPVEVPPNIHEARVVAELSDQSKVRVLPLTTIASPWLLAFAPEQSLDHRPVRALLVVPDTEESPGTEVVAEGARVDLEQQAPRRLLVRLTPSASAQRIPVAARTLDGTVRAIATLEVTHPVPAAAPVTPARPPKPLRWDLSGAVGGFVGGGANSGPAVTLTGGLGLPGLPLVVELELGVRGASLSVPMSGLGVQRSSLLVVPVELGLRWEALEYRNFRLSTRVGGGVLLGSHRLESTFDTSFSEGALGYEVFAAVQAGLAAGPVEPYLELRGSLSGISTDHLDARPGGGVFLIGVRGGFQ
jgi:hypothetical protein